MNTALNTEAENYWRVLKDTSYEVKLWLINRLSFSLIENKPQDLETMADKIRTQEFVKEFAGCWKSEHSAEEIIEIIKNNSSSKEPPVIF